MISTGYDAANRPTLVTNGSTNYITVGSYAPSGGVTSYTYGNGLARAQSFNNRLQPTEMADALSSAPSSPLLDLTYFYGGVTSGTTTKNNGNPTQIGIQTRQTPSSSTVGFTQTFGYDALNRISAASDSGGWSQSFLYDRYGNMSGTSSGLSGVPALPTSGSYNTSTNRLTSAGSSYDTASGNQTVLGSSTLSYDGENRQSVDYDSYGVTYTYAYDGLGQRVSKTVTGGAGSTVYVRDALGNLAAEYTSSTEAPPCSPCYLSWDHLGSTRMVTDQSGNVIANGRHDYLPFGYEIPGGTVGRTSGVWGEPDLLTAKFTGQERDTETGFDNFPARYMASMEGRFLRPDPGNAGADVTNPQSWNMYSYTLNNPMAFVDPTGLFTAVPCDANGLNPNDGTTTCSNGGGSEVFITLQPGQCYQIDGFDQNCNDTLDPLTLPGTGTLVMYKSAPASQTPVAQARAKKPCAPLANNLAGPANGLDTLIGAFTRVTHPLDMLAVSATMFLAAGGQMIAGGLAIAGGCLEPSPLEPLTCLAGGAAGTASIAGGTASGAFAVYFFKNYTLPAIKDWGCNE